MSRRVLFLDRDGVINVDHAYVHKPSATEWVPGIFDLARRAHAAGLERVVITNQAGIARGYFDEATFLAYMAWITEAFKLEGCPLLAVYFCPHHPKAGVGALRVDCECRKPAPGMILNAAREWDIDLANSWLVGDKAGDVEAGLAAGVGHNCLFLSPLYPPPKELLHHPGVKVVRELREISFNPDS
jgi:D-glycero-D-manno-heptose 1,7-bisphosphate phosphatase